MLRALINPLPISVLAVCEEIKMAMPAKAKFPAINKASKAATLPWMVMWKASQGAGTANFSVSSTAVAFNNSGTASLAGALNVALTNGFYPPANASFTFLTAATRTGTFATFNYPSNDVGLLMNYTATNASAQVINVRPALPVFANQTNAE